MPLSTAYSNLTSLKLLKGMSQKLRATSQKFQGGIMRVNLLFDRYIKTIWVTLNLSLQIINYEIEIKICVYIVASYLNN